MPLVPLRPAPLSRSPPLTVDDVDINDPTLLDANKARTEVLGLWWMVQMCSLKWLLPLSIPTVIASSLQDFAKDMSGYVFDTSL